MQNLFKDKIHFHSQNKKASDSPELRHDYVRALYLAMLETLPDDLIWHFWAQLPLQFRGRKVSGVELFEFLWTRKGKITIDYNVEVCKRLEPVLVNHGYSMEHLIQRMFRYINSSTFIPGWLMLKWISPLFPLLSRFTDPREWTLKALPLVSENYIPNSVHRVIKQVRKGQNCASIVLFCQDLTFSKRWVHDVEMDSHPFLMYGTAIFGIPPFEKSTVLSDLRDYNDVLWHNDYSVIGEIIYIRNERFGRYISFKEFCDRHGLDLSEYMVPNWTVALMERPYFCNRRNREVLHKDCVYGAPVFLSQLEYSNFVKRPKKPLTHLILDAAKPEFFEPKEMKKRHLNFIKSISGKQIFYYRKDSDSVVFNGILICRGIQARIFAKILRCHVIENRNTFNFKEFRNDPHISHGHHKLYIESRINALQNQLKKSGCRVELLKTGGGEFMLLPSISLYFQEV